MEIFILIVIIIIAAFLIFKLSSTDDGIQGTLVSSDQNHQTQKRPPTKSEFGPTQRFDESRSQYLRQSHTLSGHAWITDGDTVVIEKTQVRLFGIDAPELNHPFGMKAKWALHRLCKGQKVRAEITQVDN